jgi:hypothetical protein
MLNHESTNSVSSTTTADEIENVAPTILTQTKAHPSRSKKYSVVNTGNILKQFEDAGWESQLIKKVNPTKEENKGYEMHLYCLTHPSVSIAGMEKELKPRLYLKNSYNGTSKLEYIFGLIRFFCTNGLVLGNIFESIKRRHMGISQSEIQDMTLQMKSFFETDVAPFILNLKDTVMTERQMLAFAQLALAERFSKDSDFVKGEHEKLLTVNHVEDREPTAWNVLNRVQENLGLSYRKPTVSLEYVFKSTDKDDKPIEKKREMSAVTDIKRVTHLNRYLFDSMGRILQPKNEQIAMAA